MQKQINEAISRFIEMRNNTVDSQIDSAFFQLRNALRQSAKISAALELLGQINSIFKYNEKES